MFFISPFLVAGEKKLKTGEKMVPSRVVRGGLLTTSSESSNLPLGLLVSWFVVSIGQSMKRKTNTFFFKNNHQIINAEETI